MQQGILAKGVEIVGFLFAAFGGFLTGIAPPETADARFAVGLSSFLALILLLIIAALAQPQSPKRWRNYWLGAAICLCALATLAAFVYKSYYDTLTFEFPPGSTKVEHIAGTELMPDAQLYKQRNPGISNAQLLDDFGGLENKGLVWTEESTRKARTHLIGSYVVLVLTLAGSIFALTEGTLARPQRGLFSEQTKNNSM
jgi:hypothetical protein